MKVALLFPILIFTVWILPSAGEESPAKEEILEEILQKAEESEKASQNKGFYLESTVRKLTEEGAVKGEETRSYRIIWIHDQPYAELIRINGKDLDPKSKADEEKRRREFAKKLEESRKQEEEVFAFGSRCSLRFVFQAEEGRPEGTKQNGKSDESLKGQDSRR